MIEAIVIIGAGQAAAQAAISLRAGGFEGALTMIGAEPVLPYQRPPLSKTFLAGELAAERLSLRPEAFYTQKRIALHLGARVEAIDREGKEVLTSLGQHFPYDVAVIATGGQPRRLSLQGSNLEGVCYLHDLDESRFLQDHFKRGTADGTVDDGDTRLVIVGGGYIGLEAAATARKLGLDVVILEAAERILMRVAAPEISDFFTRLHQQHGVRVEVSAQPTAFIGEQKILAVRDEAHGDCPADIALVGVGLAPDVELAMAAQLKVDNGITVDEEMRTSDPSIYAIGDCASALLPLYPEHIRLESVQNAIYQAKIAAASICGGQAPPVEAPWFWSDQYDTKLQIAGLARAYDQTVLRGRVEDHSFVLFYLSGDQLLAADCINRPQEFLLSRRVIAQKGKVSPARLADSLLSPQEALNG